MPFLSRSSASSKRWSAVSITTTPTSSRRSAREAARANYTRHRARHPRRASSASPRSSPASMIRLPIVGVARLRRHVRRRARSRFRARARSPTRPMRRSGRWPHAPPAARQAATSWTAHERALGTAPGRPRPVVALTPACTSHLDQDRPSGRPFFVPGIGARDCRSLRSSPLHFPPPLDPCIYKGYLRAIPRKFGRISLICGGEVE